MLKRNWKVGMWKEIVCLAGLSCMFTAATQSHETAQVGSAVRSADAIKATVACQAPNAVVAGTVNVVPEGTVLKLYLPDSIRLSRLSPGTQVAALLARPLFSGNRVAIPAGSRVQIEINAVEKVKTSRSTKEEIAAGVNRAFNPLNQGSPTEYSLQLGGATVTAGAGYSVPLRVTFLRTARLVEIAAKSKTPREAGAAVVDSKQKKVSRQVLLVELKHAVEVPAFATADAGSSQESVSAGTEIVRTANRAREGNQGWHARALLLTALSATENHEGDPFQARLTEPTQAGDTFLPVGTLMEGHVARGIRPRWLSRPGVLVLKVDRVFSSNGTPLRVSGSLEEADAERSSRFVMDDEGALRGRKPGIGAAAVDIGIAYALGKVSDDLSEAPIRALAASMSDAAVANAARYVGLAAATAFLVTRHGRDVRLPKYSEIEVYFGRNPETEAN